MEESGTSATSSPQKMAIVYERAKEAPVFACTGAQVSPTPHQRSLNINFYVEYHALPNSITMTPDEDGNYDPSNGHVISRGDWVRDIQAIAVMDIATARQLGELLIRACDALQKKSEEGE